jgi:hypothetical protein
MALTVREGGLPSLAEIEVGFYVGVVTFVKAYGQIASLAEEGANAFPAGLPIDVSIPRATLPIVIHANPRLFTEDLAAASA